jgi:hypothetical protein
MLSEDFEDLDRDDEWEKIADEALAEMLNLSREQRHLLFQEARPNVDPRLIVFRAAERAAALCAAESRQQPSQLRQAFAAVRQLPLPLENGTPQTPSLTLLIDQDAGRLLVRRELFEKKKLLTESTTSLTDAMKRLDDRDFRLVIVDYDPNTYEEDAALQALQRFNTSVPIINARAWAPSLLEDQKHLNHELMRVATRLSGLPVPKRLPPRRAPGAATEQPRSRQLKIGRKFFTRS